MCEREFLSRMIQKSITEHSRVKVLHRPIGYGYKLAGDILFTLLEPVEGKSEGTVVVLERQRAPGTAMKNAPTGAIDAAMVEVMDVGAKSAEAVAKEFIGRRIFILEKVGNKLREKDILLGLLDFEKSDSGGWTVKHLIEKQTSVQTVILSKERFSTVSEAREWIREHDFKDDKVDEKPETFRFRQFPPEQCKSDTSRTIEITRGVVAVICVPEGQETPEGANFSEPLKGERTKSEAIKSKIPNQFRYWEATNLDQANIVFGALLEAISDGTINLSKEKS
ncbi:hypothetical protein LCGC14_1167090 [marine sediment metagenome]|uniref:Uncharacterized protein n=1 Tax=marine sediment metagenome TaxID=412755 RepID=A0A0F9MDW4_9ZZZZ